MPEAEQPSAIYRLARPDLIVTVLCLLLFTGPPKFRVRDPQASLSGLLDPSLILNVLVWLAGGTWVAVRAWRAWTDRRFRIPLFLSHGFAAPVVALLGVSTLVSLDPKVTAFKVFQITVAVLFTAFFIESYGIERFLKILLAGCAVLCTLIVVCSAVAPDLVLSVSETGAPRLRGEAIADAGVVAVLGTILLFTTRRKLSLTTFLLLSMLFGSVLFFSLARIAWLAVAVFFAIAVLKRPRIHTMKWIYAFWVAVIVALLVGAVSQVDMLRDPESVSDLSGRLGLWAYLGTVTLSQSPWLGLGYFAASREIGMEYDPELGSGHSIFFDVFVGGGIVTECAFLVLVSAMMVYAFKLLWRRRDSESFAVSNLMIAAFLVGAVGANIDSSPFGFTFWALVTMLPLLTSQSPEEEADRVPGLAPWPSPIPAHSQDL
jgi:O-antigen ligase